MSDADLAFRLRAPYRALYLAAQRAESEARAAEVEAARPVKAAAEPPNPAHAEFRDQIADLLADVDMSEDDRQRVLASLSCTCCGGSGLSLAFELKPADRVRS